MFGTQEAFFVVFKVIKFLGIWKVSKSSRAYRIYSFLLHFIISFLYTFFIALYLFHIEDIVGFSDCISIFLTMVCYTIKALNFILNLENLLSLIKTLNELINSSDLEKLHDHKRVRNQVGKGKMIYRVFVFVTATTTTLEGLVPIFNWREHELAYKMYFPMVDYKNNDAVFIFLAVLQMTPVAVSLLCITLDTIPVIFMCLAVGVLEELSDRLKEIGYDKEHDSPKNIEKSQKIKIKNSNDLKELIKCIEMHQEIKKCIADIQKYFAAVIMTQGIMSSIILCTIAFTMSFVSWHNNLLTNEL